MNTFNVSETGRISDAIGKAISKVARLNPYVMNHAEDVSQTTWIKVLLSYDAATDMRARNFREAGKEAPTITRLHSYKTTSTERAKWSSADHDRCPEAFAYRVAYRIALDFLRGREYAGGSKNHASLDAEVNTDDGSVTIGDLVPCQDPTALDLIMSGEIDAKLAVGLASLTPAQGSAIKADLADERALTGSERIGKMRAIEAMQYAITA